MISVNNICMVELFSRQSQHHGRQRKKGLTSQTSNRTSQLDLCYRNIGTLVNIIHCEDHFDKLSWNPITLHDHPQDYL